MKGRKKKVQGVQGYVPSFVSPALGKSSSLSGDSLPSGFNSSAKALISQSPSLSMHIQLICFRLGRRVLAVCCHGNEHGNP